MGIGIVEINHAQITVPREAEEASRHFYKEVLGLEEIPKPNRSAVRGGAWYRHGGIEIHLSVEEDAIDNSRSRRHICYVVADLAEAEQRLHAAGVEILPDKQPVRGWVRFYARDPGGNRIEIAQRKPEN